MLMPQLEREVTILLVDDDDVDVLSIERSLKKQNFTCSLMRARDGVEGLAFLRTLVDTGKRFIVLLDINMPIMSGFEMLAKVRAETHMASSLVFILTTSHSPEDKASCYEKNVAGFIVKNKLDNGFINLISMLRNYLEVVELPDC